MSERIATTADSVAAFARDVERIIAREQDRQQAVAQIRPLLVQLLAQTNLLDDRYRAADEDGRARYHYYRSADGRLSISGPVFEPGHPTVVHNHNTWGLIGIVSGKQRTTRYARTDDGSTAERATLVQTADEVLAPGSIYALLPPDDIQRIEALDEPSLSIHVLGVDLSKQHRQFFDLDAGTYRDVVGERVMR